MKKITYSELTKEVLDQLGTVYWGEPDQETYSDIDPTEAIFQAIDLYDWEELQELTELKIVAVRPKTLTPVQVLDSVSQKADDLLAEVLENLHDDYGNPYEDTDPPSPAMKDLCEKFSKNLAEVIVNDFSVWLCDRVLEVTVTNGELLNMIEQDVVGKDEQSDS
jgi:hypothetical protein